VTGISLHELFMSLAVEWRTYSLMSNIIYIPAILNSLQHDYLPHFPLSIKLLAYNFLQMVAIHHPVLLNTYKYIRKHIQSQVNPRESGK